MNNNVNVITKTKTPTILATVAPISEPNKYSANVAGKTDAPKDAPISWGVLVEMRCKSSKYVITPAVVRKPNT
jgi:hypothetical protein